MKQAVAVALCGVAWAPLSAAAAEGMRIGVAEVLPSGTVCVTMPDAELRPGARVFFALLTTPQQVLPGRVTEPSPRCTARADVQSAVYSARLDEVSGWAFELGIALAGLSRSPAVENGRIVISGADTEPVIHLNRCASDEGLHFSAWRDGQRIWHQYHYLGYDLEPNCREGELR